MCSTTYSIYLCFIVTRMFQRCFSMNIRGCKNYTYVQLRIHIESLLAPSRPSRHTYNLNILTSVLCRSWILVCASKGYLRSGSYILSIQIRNRLRDRFLFKFVLLLYIIIGFTKIFFWQRLKFNPFMNNFVHFTILILTWCNLTSYYIVLPM